VYGTQPNLDPVTENAPLNAMDIYGASKIAMEAALRAHIHDLGLPAAVLRVASVYGPGRTTDCFIRDLIQSATTGVPRGASAQEGCRRQFVHIDDVVHAIVQAVAAPDLVEFDYNIGGGTWLTERELASIAATVLPELKISDASVPENCIDGRMGPLDSSRAAGAFGYIPAVELRQGIASYAAHLAAEAALANGPAQSGKLLA
jgi:UDP-glucuronate 4-epimerase